MRLLPLPGVFQPPSDAWMLAAVLRAQPLPVGARVLDLCAGSGALAIAAAREHAGAVVTAVDVSRRAIAAVRLNARLNGARVEACRGDLFDAVPGRRFDLVVSNPPYVPGPSRPLPRLGLDRAWEGGPDGRAVLDRICAQVHDHLAPGGIVLLVHNAMCDERATVRRLRATGLDAEVVFRHRGALGPILRDRAGWLRSAGLLGDDEGDEVIVVRGSAPAAGPRALTEPSPARTPVTLG